MRKLNEDGFANALETLQLETIQDQALSLSGPIQAERGAEAAADLIEAIEPAA